MNKDSKAVLGRLDKVIRLKELQKYRRRLLGELRLVNELIEAERAK